MLERFFTDAVSNTVVLDDVQGTAAQLSLTSLMADGRPLRLLLHEKTHHACFDSDVGAALGAIHIMAAQPIDPGWVSSQLTIGQRDFLVARFAYRLLEPLLEGLALFAEFDALPGSSPIASQVSGTAVRLLFDRPAPADAFEQLAALLQAIRMQPEAGSDKQRAFTRPLAGPPAYLLGYLAVKGLYWRLLSKCPRLSDTDLYLMLMTDYWFHDRELTNRLQAVNTPIDPDDLFREMIALAGYLTHRANRLLEHVDAYVSELLSFVSSSPAGPRAMGAGGVPSYQNPGAPPPPFWSAAIRTGQLANHSAAAVFGHRPDFRFASTPVTVTITPGRTATLTTAGGRVIGHGIPCVPLTTPGTYPGALEGVVMPLAGMPVATVISAVDGLVAVRDEDGTWNPPALVKYFDEFPSAIEVLDVIRDLSLGQATTSATAQVAPQLERFDARAAADVIDVYLPWATGRLDPARRPACATALAAAGFAGPMPDRRLLEVISGLSVTCGCRTLSLSRLAGRYGGTAPVTVDVDRINAALEPIFGINALFVGGDAISSLV